jgi:RNA-directed DNA polymerase
MSDNQTTETTAAAPEERLPDWAGITAEGGIHGWVHAELMRRGLIEEIDTSALSDKERKKYKARREEERRVRRVLRKHAWSAFRQANIVHLGPTVFYHDTADVDRFDIADPAARRVQNDLPELKDAAGLAAALGLSVPRLRWLTYHRDVDSGTHYQRWTVPKRDGGLRLISSPKPDLKAAQRWIARKITERLPVHGAAHGFLGGRGTQTNAEVHAGARLVVKLDIKDFYPSVTFPRVKGMMRKAGYGEQVATLLALLCTEAPREELTIRGKRYHVALGPRSLPQGAPTSPSITNTLCLKLDSRLAGLARKLGYRYTRYADDMTFSWHESADPPLGKLLFGVSTVVADEGFTLHRKKTRVLRSGRRQKVTGLVVNSAPEGAPPARVPRRLVRALRAAIHNRERGQAGKGESLAQLRGMAAYIYMADPRRGREFLERLDRLARSAEESEETP